MSTTDMPRKRKRRRLSPSEKYEIYVSVLTGQCTQREAADRFGVDRSTVVTACRIAKQGALAALATAVPGRPGVSREAVLEASQVEIERAAGHGHRAGRGAAPARGKSALSRCLGESPYRGPVNR